MTRAAIQGRLGDLTAVPLTLCFVAVTLLCHASPPDPTWIAGLYDDNDHDDVVLTITGAVAVPTAAAPQLGAPAEAHAAAAPVRVAPSTRSVVARSDRAPPLA